MRIQPLKPHERDCNQIYCDHIWEFAKRKDLRHGYRENILGLKRPATIYAEYYKCIRCGLEGVCECQES